MTTEELPLAERQSARIVHLREAAAESLWLAPLAFIVGAIVLSVATAELDSRVGFHPDRNPIFTETVDDARAVVSTIATSMLTFLGVVFSITLVALQMASTQYSPRVVRQFVRSRTTKLTLATFLGTFVYCLVVLGSFDSSPGSGATSGAPDRQFVPVVSVVVAESFVLVCLLVFVAFVHHTVRSMRVTYLVRAVADETRRSLEINAAAVEVSVELDERSLGEPDLVIRWERHPGVLASVAIDRLVAIAQEADVVMAIVPRIGTYLVTGAPVVRVWGTGAVRRRSVIGCMEIGVERTLYQDSSYGIRQLVDIAIRALSPAVNDPTTAVQVIDRLVDLLSRIAHQLERSNGVVDTDGHVRVLVNRPSWSDAADLAFAEIRIYGTGSPQVTRRLMAAWDQLEDLVPARAVEAVERQRALLLASVEREVPDHAERLVALEPDARGLG